MLDGRRWVTGSSRTDLKPSHEEAVCTKLSEASNTELKKRENSPTDIKTWYQPVHWYISEQEHDRDLSRDGADDVEGLELDKLIALEPKIFFETSNVGIVFYC